MNSQEIVDYVMNTPNNTNPVILKQMIDANSSGGATSWNDLTDKPFGKELAEVVHEENVWEVLEPKGYYFLTIPKLIAGKEYTVVWNGVEYVRTAKEAFTETDEKAVVLGNVAASHEGFIYFPGEDTGEPFLVFTKNGDSYANSMDVGEVSFVIKTVEEVVTPIADEFIPDTVFKNGDTRFWLTSPSGASFYFMVNDNGELVPWEK